MTDREYLVQIGINVRAARKRMHYSQAVLADLLGMNHKTIQRIEGAIKEPHITTLKRIAEALRTDLRHLLP